MKKSSLILVFLLLSSCLKNEQGNSSRSNKPPLEENSNPSEDNEEAGNSTPEVTTEEPKEVINELTFYQGSTYLAKFETLNPSINGIIAGSSTLHFREEMILSYVRVFGGFPKAWHQQKIYNGSRCPSIDDDLNQDGFIDIIEAEKVAGGALIPLDANISGQNAGKNFYPIGDDSGNYFYERITQFKYLLSDLKSEDWDLTDNIIKIKPGESLFIENKPIIIYGVSEEVDLPETVLTIGKHKSFQTFPIVCGTFKKVTSFPDSNETDEEEIPGPIEVID